MKPILLLLLTISTALAGKWTLTWDANPSAEQVTSYEVFDVTSTTNSLGIVATNAIVLNNVSNGSHTYQVVAIDLAGIRSDPSTNATFAFPQKPKNLNITP